MNENSNRRVDRIELGLWLQIDNLVRGLGLLLLERMRAHHFCFFVSMTVTVDRESSSGFLLLREIEGEVRKKVKRV